MFRYGLSFLITALFSASTFAEKECKLGLTKPFPQLPALASPVDMVQAKNDSSRWFAALRDGKIVSFANDSAADTLVESLDITYKVNNQVEMGLTGIALHPDFPKDNRIFVTYNDSSKGNQSTLASFLVNTETHVIDPKSEKALLILPQDGLFHNGGNVIFGPDGMLYSGFGDGGYTLHYSQDTENLYGTVIRIDINDDPYSAPKDNPYNEGQELCLNGSGDDDCPEIFAHGLRNPWRFNFDEVTGKLWLADVGEEAYEEINLIEPGNNYGWPKVEGLECFDAWFCITWGLTDPMFGYDLEGPQSIVGGFVYRGKNIPSLQGKYIYGDTFEHGFYSLDENAEAFSPSTFLFKSGTMVASMAQDNEGELYLLNFAGTKTGEGILKIDQLCSD